jgi:hypothetical protein
LPEYAVAGVIHPGGAGRRAGLEDAARQRLLPGIGDVAGPQPGLQLDERGNVGRGEVPEVLVEVAMILQRAALPAGLLHERLEKLTVMIAEAVLATGTTFQLGRVVFPPGVLWNGEACVACFVRKDQLGPAVLAAGLRKHLGYELPEPDSDVFTLGVTPEDDTRLERVGLFGQKRA